MRTVVLHYHLFKNAGTSVDAVLQDNFGAAWVTAEFPMTSTDNSALLAEWISANPTAKVFSTHTGLGPLPQVEGVTVVPVVFLRDPVARIASAYRFERKQKVDNWGTELARAHDLEGYVKARLARKADRQCRNFQVSRLAPFFPQVKDERAAALQALGWLNEVGVVGLVESFDASMDRLGACLQRHFPEFKPQSVRKNTTDSKSAPLSPALDALLREVNADDLALLSAARALLD